MDLLKEYIPYYLHSMVDMIGEENFLKICKMYGGSSIYIPVYKRATQGIRNAAIWRITMEKILMLLGLSISWAIAG